jgi:hypothetical protein
VTFCNTIIHIYSSIRFNKEERGAMIFPTFFSFISKETKINVKDRRNPPMCSLVGTNCYLHCKYIHHLTRTSNFQLKCGTRFHKLPQILEQRRTLDDWNEKFYAYSSSMILHKRSKIGFRVAKLNMLALFLVILRTTIRNFWGHACNIWDDIKFGPRF